MTRKFCNHVPSNKEMFRKYSCDFKKERTLLKLFSLKALLSSEYKYLIQTLFRLYSAGKNGVDKTLTPSP